MVIYYVEFDKNDYQLEKGYFNMNIVAPIKIQGKKIKIKTLIKNQEIIKNKIWIEPFLDSDMSNWRLSNDIYRQW